MCHPVTGCVCKSGFRGHDCREAALDHIIGENPESEYLKLSNNQELPDSIAIFLNFA